jgi:hypothetical protein
MSTFTPASFNAATQRVSLALEKATDDRTKLAGESLKKHMVALSAAAPVPVSEHSFVLKFAGGRRGFSSSVLVAHGFAILAEFGSYHHPGKYPISPRSFTKRQGGSRVSKFKSEANARRAHLRRVGTQPILANEGKDFIATGTVMHPPIKATPYAEAAIAATNAESRLLFAEGTAQALATGFGF